MTERCYYQDAYTRSFTAKVVERIKHDTQPALVLNKTFFYPTSGGQPADQGSIDNVTVVDVFIREDDGAIVHVLEKEVWSDEVQGNIHWPRRFDHMQQHSGQHILSQAFIQTASARTVAFHLSENSVTIDLACDELHPAQVEEAESLANQIVWDDRPVRVHLLPLQKVKDLNLRKMPDVEGDTVRLIDIAEFDLTACGGTHVSRTGAVGMIKILKLESHRGNYRVEFACGRRALTDYRQKNRIINRLATEFTTSFSEVEHSVAKLRDEAKQLQRQNRLHRGEVMQLLSNQLLQNAQVQNGHRIITEAFQDRDPEDLKVLAGQLVREPGVVALLGLSGKNARLVFARSETGPGAMDKLLKSALDVLGNANGGGSAHFAQGGGPPADVERIQRALARAKRLLLAQLH